MEIAADDEKPATVKWIMYAFDQEDWSLRGIAKELNGRRIAAPRGNGWNSNTVRHILTNQVYLGNRYFGRRRSGKYHQVGQDGEITQANGSRTTQAAPIVAENTHEALVDPMQFERIQRKLAANKAGGHRPRTSPYVLREVLKCGHCGRSLSGQPGDAKKNRRYYRCPAGNDGRCKLYSIRKDQIEAYVVAFLDKWLQTPVNRSKVEASLHRRAKAGKGFQQATSGLKTKIAALDKKIAKGSENLLLADPCNLPELSDLLTKWRKERDRLQAELETAATCPKGQKVAEIERKAREHMATLREAIGSDEPPRVRQAIQTLVEDIRLFWEDDGSRYRRLSRGVITIKYTNGFALDDSNTASGYRRWETTFPLHRPAK